MWNWSTPCTKRPAGTEPILAALRLEALEAREVPAVLIQVDYSLDTGFFTRNPNARAVMDRVATELGNSLSADLPALAANGDNTWSATFFSPTTGSMVSVANPTIGANTIRVYVGARAMTGGEAGYASTSGTTSAGSQEWVDTVSARNWGGSIAFDTNRNWFFGQTTAGLTSNKLDFYSVANHELGHVLGLGLSKEWNSLARGGYFYGPSAMAVYGGPVPLGPDGEHWADGITVAGHDASLDPEITYGQRVGWSSLDAAALIDLGWGASTNTPALAATTLPQPLAVATGGEVSLVSLAGGTLAPTGGRFAPFAGYTGELRVAAGDFNGDAVTDYAVATSPGAGTAVAVVNGRDGSFIVGPTSLWPGYTGGFQLAAGDTDGDGRAELVVAAGTNAPPVVGTFDVVNGGLQLQAAFTAFDAAWYTGGIRVAAGDINRDGFADVVVTTASGVGAVIGYSGATLRHGAAVQLFSPFMPLAGSPLGLSVAVGDMDGDGFADMALTFEAGGPAVVGVWSGAAISRFHSRMDLLPATSSFLSLPGDDIAGARLTMRDVDGDGRADLVVASRSQQNRTLRAFTQSQMIGVADAAGDSLDPNDSGIYIG